MLQKLRKNKEGFTLIELMIVIAIIGILAAIAIPNFIAYRNKSFCSTTESDAQAVAAAVADYFAIPTHTVVPARADLNGGSDITLSGSNTIVTLAGNDPNLNITIVVQDASTRCPSDYQNAMTPAANPKSYWDGANNYTLLIAP